MKILAFTDIHANFNYFKALKEKASKVDYIICAGDVGFFGEGLEETMEEINNLGKKVFIIPGNEPHEDEFLFKALCEELDNLIYIHKEMLELDDFTLIGIGFGGFSKRDREFEVWVKTLNLEDKKIIFIHHAPPYKTNLDVLSSGHHGCKSYTEFIKKYQPIISISGHFHETFGLQDKINETIIMNPGPKGKIIEL